MQRSHDGGSRLRGTRVDAAYEYPLAVIAQPITCPVFLGREDELEALADARRALSKSRGSVVLLGGEAGIGKSRLLAQFLGTVRRDTRPRHLATAECSEYAQMPFGPFREIVIALRDAVPADDLPEIARRTVQRFSRGVTGDLDPVEGAEMFAGVLAFLRAISERRATILAIDDVHWCDRTSLELFSYLTPRLAGSRILIVATYRSSEVAGRESLRAALGRIAGENNVVRIGLDPFDDPRTRELIAHALGDRGSIDPRIFDDVVRRSEGNPFFAEELLKDALQFERRPERPTLPLSIRASIGERLALMPPAERRVIDQAAVLGVRFDPNLLAATMRVAVDAILPALRSARDLNILLEEERDGIRFRFRHALTRQAVYDDMLLVDVRRTHRDLLAALEALGDTERHIDALAYHAWEARDAEKALAYNERAGEAALELRALPEARACFDRALDAASDDATRARLYARAAAVAEMHGELHDAIALYDAAFARFREGGDYDRACDMVRAMATTRSNLADEKAVAYGVAFLEEFGSRISRGPRDQLLALLARGSTIICDTELALRLLARVEVPSELPPRALQNYLTVKMDVAFAAGDIDAWRPVANDLWATLDHVPPFNATIVGDALAHSASWLGERAISDRAFLRGDGVYRRWDFAALRAHGDALRAERAWLVGDLARSRAYVLNAQRGSEAKVAAMALALIAPLVAAALDEPALVTSSLDEIFRNSLLEGREADDALILAALAAWRAHQGRDAEARAAIARSIACLRRPEPWVAAPLTLAASLLAERDLEPLLRLLEMPILSGDAPGNANVALARAIVEHRFGSRETARSSAHDAAARYERLQWPLFAARAYEIAGDHAHAFEIFERCGATTDSRRLRVSGDGSTIHRKVLAPGASGALAALSERELAIARAMAAGATNVAIGESLGVSVKTVEKHVSTIFTKLGVNKRTQVVALLARQE